VKTIIYEKLGEVSVRDVPDPELLQPTDVLVRVQATTICGSDLHIVAGHVTPDAGFPLGHEYVGKVYATGSAVTRFAVGDRVTGPAAPYCRSCEMCQRGQHQLCSRGGILGCGPTIGGLGGTQSELLRVPWAEQNLVAVPDHLSDAAAIAVGDILPTGWTGVQQTDPRPGDTVLVLGCGPVGLSAIHTAKHLTSARQVIACDPLASRRKMALALGADAVLDSGPDSAEKIRELTEGRGADAIIDAAGVQPTIDLAADVVAVGGRISELGIAAQPFLIDFGALLMKNVRLWTGLGDLSQMELLMGCVANGTLDPTPLFTHTATLGEAPEIYQRLANGNTDIVKVLLTVP
jgi:alcohol dehydrogenase